MTDKCPNCGEVLTKNERLRKYYCSSCGYQIKFDSIKVDDIPKKEMEKIESPKIEESNDFILNCPECGGEYTFDNGEIYCKTCGKNHEIKKENNNLYRSLDRIIKKWDDLNNLINIKFKYKKNGNDLNYYFNFNSNLNQKRVLL